MQTGFADIFNGRMRDEFLNETLFRNLTHARELITVSITDYNTTRPHAALGYQTPAEALQIQLLHFKCESTTPAALG